MCRGRQCCHSADVNKNYMQVIIVTGKNGFLEVLNEKYGSNMVNSDSNTLIFYTHCLGQRFLGLGQLFFLYEQDFWAVLMICLDFYSF